VALIAGLSNPLAPAPVSESEWTLDMLKTGQAVLADSEQREPWRNPTPEPPRNTKFGRERVPPAQPAPKKRQPPGIKTQSFDRREALRDMAERLTRKRTP
jgi:hypothetical protein